MNINHRIVEEALALSAGTVDDVAQQVEGFGSDLKMERSNLLRTRLSVEEILLRWMEHFGEGTPLYFSMGYRWRQPYVSLDLSVRSAIRCLRRKSGSIGAQAFWSGWKSSPGLPMKRGKTVFVII